MIDALIKCNYDFLQPSEVELNDFKNINTFEALILAYTDTGIFKKVSKQIHATNEKEFFKLVDEIQFQKGRFLDLMFEISLRKDIQDSYIKTLQDIANGEDSE